MDEHRSTEEIEAAMRELGKSPLNEGTVEMIVGRPGVDERRTMERGDLDPDQGLVGDGWLSRGAPKDAQVTLMNSRVIEAVAGDRERWALAGDQLFVDLDLSDENLPPGQRLAIGPAVIEITAKPHTGCAKFGARYGRDAVRFVNSQEGLKLRRRGVNARVVQGGTVSVGDRVRKIGAEGQA